MRYLTPANVSGWHWWFLSDGLNYDNGTDDATLTDVNLNYPKHTYVTGRWSKCVRPGWVRIGVALEYRTRDHFRFRLSRPTQV
jgi:O-glycosyl hydrolase